MDNKKSDTIEQQKKARKEFLELKKMQSGEVAPPPKPSEVAVLPKTVSEKAKNFWFHYKTATIISLFLCAVIAFCVAQCAAKPHYDVTAVVYTNNYYTGVHTAVFEEYLKQYAADYNGDGEVLVQVIDCSYDKAERYDHDYITAAANKLQATVAGEADVQLYITDANTAAHLNEMAKDFDSFFIDSALIDPSLNELASAAGVQLPESLTIGCRIVAGTQIEGHADVEMYAAQAKEVLDKIRAK